MGLHEQLDSFKSEFAHTAPSGHTAFCEAKIQELRAALCSNNKALPTVNGDESWELPVPATYVIAPDGRITLAYIEADYRQRLEPAAILAALQSLRPA